MSNLLNNHQMTEIHHLLSIALACICGYAIGYERRSHNKQAGIRTHIIVALTATLMMILSKEAFLDTPEYDTSRVAAQIVSGISFIGGGIIFMRDKKISGITTAAGIWATAGIGMAIGGGFWFLGSVCCAIVVIIQILTHKNNKAFLTYYLKITGIIPDLNTLNQLHHLLEEKNFKSVTLNLQKIEERYELTLLVENDSSFNLTDFQELLTKHAISFDIQTIKLKQD